MKQKQKHYYHETNSHNTPMKLPYDQEIEKVVLFCLLSGRCEEAIIDKLDAACFYDPLNVKIYKVIKALHDSNGSIQKTSGTDFLEMINMKSQELKEHFSNLTGRPEDMGYYILHLHNLKMRRIIISDCEELKKKALDDTYDPINLIDDCEKMTIRVKEAGVDWTCMQDMEDWFIKPDDPKADKYKVMKGKRDGWSDYCTINGVNVNERDMLSMGYQRVSLSREKKDKEDPSKGQDVVYRMATKNGNVDLRFIRK